MSNIIPTKRAALYVRVSTADKGQTVENQLQPLQEAAARLGWSIVAVHRDEGISGGQGIGGSDAFRSPASHRHLVSKPTPLSVTIENSRSRDRQTPRITNLLSFLNFC
ncbi:MAG TPA: recombinase family protein [Acetobacteraceae bacterium]|jgi:hypothetical protein